MPSPMPGPLQLLIKMSGKEDDEGRKHGTQSLEGQVWFFLH